MSLLRMIQSMTRFTRSSKQCWRILISSKKVMQSAKNGIGTEFGGKNIEKA